MEKTPCDERSTDVSRAAPDRRYSDPDVLVDLAAIEQGADYEAAERLISYFHRGLQFELDGIVDNTVWLRSIIQEELVAHGVSSDAGQSLARAVQVRLARVEAAGKDGGAFNRQLLFRYIRLVLGRLAVKEGDSATSWKPAQALGLEPRQGERGHENTEQRDIEIAAYVVLARRRTKKPSLEEALGEAANRFCDADGGDRIVERAYRKYQALFECFPDDSLRG
ncbi:MAG: hypothetical protein Q4G39_09530, partial [Brachymonas sp.]|nr:hypothetical protein [Brachymonas sp.]